MTAFLFEPGEDMRLEGITVEDVRVSGEGQRELIRLKPVVNQYMRKQVPGFVRNDDINLAYEAANGVVDLGNPGGSMMVTKVGGGHNCWLAANSACADQLTVWIRNWAGQTLGGTRGVNLQPPPLRDVGASKSFPSSSALFGSTVYPLLTQYCARCHSSGASTPQSPFFAEGDVDVAYAAVRAYFSHTSQNLRRVSVV